MEDSFKSILKYILVSFIVLVYFELLLYFNLHHTLKGVSIFNVLFMLSIAAIVSSFTGWHKKVNNIVFIVVLFLISIFYLGNFIYFKTFGSIVSISMVGVGGDAITNFWWSIIETIKENILMVLLFELPIILLILEAVFVKKLNNNYALIGHPIVLGIGILLWFNVVISLPLGGTADYTPYGAYHSRFIDTDTASKRLGVLPNAIIEIRYAIVGSSRQQLIEIKPEKVEEVIEVEKQVEYNEYPNLDFNKLNSDDANIRNILDYLRTQKSTNKNDYTGMFAGHNLIYICAESFSSLAIDKDITPTLYKLANNGFVLDNYYNGFKNVTTNGEYALLTGLWPDVAREETNMGRLTGTMGQSIDNDMSQSLGNMFKKTGIQPLGYHNYYGYYYGRNETLPNIGFKCKFMDDGMSFTSSWPASDLEMMQQSIDDYINSNQFCAYYMTFSGHGNYTEGNVMVQRNIAEVNSKLGDRKLPDIARGYLACNVELDKAMEYLLQRLEEANKLDNTVIVLAGDHYPYYLNAESYEALKGSPLTGGSEDYHSTCIMYNSKIGTRHIKTPCDNVDILPTILNLFGIEYDSRLYAGNDIFSDSKHIAMLYNKSFITDTVIYDATNGDIKWLKDTSKMSKELLDDYIEQCNNFVKNKYAYSIAVESYDFYNYLNNNY